MEPKALSGFPGRVKSRLEISPEASRKPPKRPEGSPRALGKRFLGSRNVPVRPFGFHVALGTYLGSNMDPREVPGTLRIKVFVWTVCNN